MHEEKLRELEALFVAGNMTKDRYVHERHAVYMAMLNDGIPVTSDAVSHLVRDGDDLVCTFADGVRLISAKHDVRSAAFEVLNFGRYEADELAVLKALLKDDDVVFDIGGNIGWYAIHCSRYVPQGKVYSFEPVPETFSYLARNVALNACDNVSVANHGFADTEGCVTFFHNTEFSTATSMRDIQNCGSSFGIEAYVKVLDAVVDACGETLDCIKCDVEGAEKLVIEGGMRTIRRDLPCMYLEMLRKWSARFDYHPNDLIALLRPLGYRVYCIVENGRLAEIDCVTDETVQTNFFFLHGEKHAREIGRLTI